MLQEALDSLRDQVESLLCLNPVVPSDKDSHRPCYGNPCEEQKTFDLSSKQKEYVRPRWDWPIPEPGAKVSRRVETPRV